MPDKYIVSVTIQTCYEVSDMYDDDYYLVSRIERKFMEDMGTLGDEFLMRDLTVQKCHGNLKTRATLK